MNSSIIFEFDKINDESGDGHDEENSIESGESCLEVEHHRNVAHFGVGSDGGEETRDHGDHNEIQHIDE